MNRYDVSDSESDYHHRGEKQSLDPLQKKIILDTIRDYCPESMNNIVYEDIIAQMEQLNKKG